MGKPSTREVIIGVTVAVIAAAITASATYITRSEVNSSKIESMASAISELKEDLDGNENRYTREIQEQQRDHEAAIASTQRVLNSILMYLAKTDPEEDFSGYLSQQDSNIIPSNNFLVLTHGIRGKEEEEVNSIVSSMNKGRSKNILYLHNHEARTVTAIYFNPKANGNMDKITNANIIPSSIIRGSTKFTYDEDGRLLKTATLNKAGEVVFKSEYNF